MTGIPSTEPARDDLAQRLDATVEPGPPAEVRLRVEPERFAGAVRELHDAGARFVTMFLADSPTRTLMGVFALAGELVLLCAPLPDRPLHDDRIGSWWPAAAWAERELHERERNAKPQSAGRLLTQPDADQLDRTVTGLDVFTIPYGPVRSGIFEAIQFQIQTGGEDVEQLQTRPFFKYRAIEARFAGMTADVAVHVAERVAGIASCAYASAFSHAVERALGVTPQLVPAVGGHCTASLNAWRVIST